MDNCHPRLCVILGSQGYNKRALDRALDGFVEARCGSVPFCSVSQVQAPGAVILYQGWWVSMCWTQTGKGIAQGSFTVVSKWAQGTVCGGVFTLPGRGAMGGRRGPGATTNCQLPYAPCARACAAQVGDTRAPMPLVFLVYRDSWTVGLSEHRPRLPEHSPAIGLIAHTSRRCVVRWT